MSWKTGNIEYVWPFLEDSAAPSPPPRPYLLYLQPSQSRADTILAILLDNYKYKYASLAYNMAQQQLAQQFGFGPKQSCKTTIKQSFFSIHQK